MTPHSPHQPDMRTSYRIIYTILVMEIILAVLVGIAVGDLFGALAQITLPVLVVLIVCAAAGGLEADK